MSTPDKYKIAREYKAGIVACIEGEAIDPKASIHWHEGYEWAFKCVKPMLHENIERYVVKMGYKPFCNLEAMRL